MALKLACHRSGVKEPIPEGAYTPPHSDISSPYHSPHGIDSDSPSSPEYKVRDSCWIKVVKLSSGRVEKSVISHIQ